jgi:hypothetical protein
MINIQVTTGGSKRSRKRASVNAATVEPEDTTISGSEKNSKIPTLDMWYLLVADRLRCLFSDPKDAELMIWWASDKRKTGIGKLKHPFDAQQWKKLNQMYLQLGDDPRNVQFVISAVEMNPFGERTSTHSTCPMILTMYNLPT